MKVHLLGPVHATVDGAMLRPARGQVRALLAVLAHDPGRAWTRSQLVEQLWPGQLPRDPAASLHVGLTHLRTALGPERQRVASDGGLYRLDLDPADVDSWRFEACVKAPGNDASRVESLRAALASWRGDVVADAVGPPVLDEFRMRMDEIRQQAVTLLIHAEREVGNPDEASRLGLLHLRNDPLREALAIATAQALVSAGRRVEALNVLSDTRQALRREQGLDASHALTELEERILRSDLDLHLAPRPPAPGSSPFVGRSAELETLAGLDGVIRWALVVGEPGSGKTTLLANAERAASLRGQLVATAAADRFPASALEPVEHLVTQVIEKCSADVLSRELVAHHGALSRLVPTLTMAGEGTPTLLNRRQLIAGIASFLVDVAHRFSLLLVVDDCQWLDNASREVLEDLASKTDGPTLLLGSRLPDAVTLGPVDRGAVVRLGALSVEEVAAYLGERGLGGNRQTTAATIHARSGGSPMLVSLLTDLILERGTSPGPLPSTIVLAVREHLDGLGPDVVETLGVAAVSGRSLSIEALRELRRDADAHVEAAVAARLLVDTAGGLAFAHDLLSETLYQGLAPGRRVELHEQVGVALAGHGAPKAELAHHFREAASLDLERAVTTSIDAAHELVDGLAYDLAIEHAQDALGLLGAAGQAETALALGARLLLGQSERRAGRTSSLDTLLDTVALARQLDDHETFVGAVVEIFDGGRTSEAGSVDAQSLALLEEALTKPVPNALRARLCSAGVNVLALSEQHERGRALFIEAERLALDEGDTILVAEVLVSGANLGLCRPEDLTRRREVARMLVELGGIGPAVACEAAFQSVHAGLITADGDLVATSLEDLRELAPRVHPPMDFGLQFTEAGVALLRGELADAERLAEAALTTGRRTHTDSWATAVYSGLLLPIRDDQGRIGELGPLVDHLINHQPDFVNWHTVAALIAADTGDASRARRELSWAMQNGFAAITPDLTWLAAMTCLARVVAFLDDREAAGQLATLLAPYAGMMSWCGTCTYGSMDMALALIVPVLGDEAAAGYHLGEAWVQAERLEAPLHLARAQLAVAESMQRGWSPPAGHPAFGWDLADLIDAAGQQSARCGGGPLRAHANALGCR